MALVLNNAVIERQCLSVPIPLRSRSKSEDHITYIHLPWNLRLAMAKTSIARCMKNMKTGSLHVPQWMYTDDDCDLIAELRALKQPAFKLWTHDANGPHIEWTFIQEVVVVQRCLPQGLR